jgi:Leucine-rich repeat (LRR) protein
LSGLSLWGNKIKTLHVNNFGNLGNLKNLYLHYNQIEEIPAKLFEENIKLDTLRIDQNKIQELPTGLFETLTDLEELAINENNLEIIHGSTFRSNKNLRKLYLSSNNIRAVAAGAFDGLKKLVILNLENNENIDQLYGSNEANDTIDLTQVSSDLSACYENYEASFRILSELTTTREDLVCPTPSATPITIYASIVTILLIISIFFIIKSNSKDKNPIGHNNFAMEKRSTHYYSQAD